MQSFVFALNATIPVFLVIALGWFLNRIGLFNPGFTKAADQYVFKCALPVSLFLSISGMDLYTDFHPAFCLFCFAVTTPYRFSTFILCSSCPSPLSWTRRGTSSPPAAGAEW